MTPIATVEPCRQHATGTQVVLRPPGRKNATRLPRLPHNQNLAIARYLNHHYSHRGTLPG